MSVSFYNIVGLYRPIGISSSNNVVQVIEDPLGSNVTLNATLTTTENIGGEYYAGGNIDPTGPPTAGFTRSVMDAPIGLNLAPLYGHIARALTAESSNVGGGYTYELSSQTPTGSSLDNSGIRITTVSGSVDIALNFDNTTLNPRYLGWGRGKVGQTDPLSALDSPYSHWGKWQSPSAPNYQDKSLKKQGFRSSKAARAQTWYWSALDRVRHFTARKVASPHLLAFDRADRQELADAAGLPKGDHNNNLEDFWRMTQARTEQRIYMQVSGVSDFGLRPDLETHNVVSIHEKPVWHPRKDTADRWGLEHYDLIWRLAMEPPSRYTNPDNVYRH